MWKRKLVLVSLLVTMIVISSTFVWDAYRSNRSYSYNSFHLMKSIYTGLGKKQEFTINNDLVQYALKKINEDRMKFNLPPVELSQNKAAQIHAEDLFKAKYPHPSHWTTDGMKPYMKYSLYNGSGYVEQNVDIRGYDNNTIAECKNNTLHCDKLNPYIEIDNAEWRMIYNDTACCKDNHKNNILDKYHTHVSLGIVYDDYYFAFVQNFENNYIQFNKPLRQNNNTHIQISELQLKNNTFDRIGVYYDDVPTHIVYEKNKDNSSYGLGKFVASVVKPPPLLFHYKQPSNYTLIQADKWSQNGQSVEVSFDLSPILKRKGVYTIVAYFTDNNNKKFPGVSHSIFF